MDAKRDIAIDRLLRTLPASATGVVVVDLGAIAANWKALQALVGPAECAAVVKADAYGLGAARVVPALAGAGCRTFFVATLDEAIAVRRLAPMATIYVLDGLARGSGAEVRASGVRPVISSLPEAREWAGVARRSGERRASALHVDTGLNRLGLSAPEVAELVSDGPTIESLDMRVVMSHLACADDPASPKNAEQRQAFERIRALLPRTRASLAASDGLMLGKTYHYDLVRPGYALYGGQAFGGGRTPVQATVELHVKVLQVRDVAPGKTVGYAATWHPSRASRIAVIAAGYADGLFRHLSRASGEGLASASVAIRGRLVPIVGRVSMDLVTVDVTDIDGPPVAPGDFVEVIGPHITIEARGAAAGTIGYEVLTSLGRRFERHYVETRS
ncbi:MAG: alanine racemase [Hyphomicrobiaceae bacterium]